jgi:hypothetical protein
VTYPNHPYLYYLIKVDNLSPAAYTNHAMCVSACPTEMTSPVDCIGTTAVAQAICSDPFDVNLPVVNTYVGYGTDPVFKKFCFPNLDKLPTQFDIS